MKLEVLGSSSAGNGYIIQSETEALILEAGVGLHYIKQALEFNISKVNACIITHQHLDHCKYADKYEKVFPTFAPRSVIERKNLKNTVEPILFQKIQAGRFTIMSFPAHHDVECLGYIIGHPDIGNLMFLTDSFMCDYKFKGLSHIMIECNYNDVALIDAIETGRTSGYQKDRLMTTHMELATTKKTLLDQDLSTVQTVTLLHLSSENSDENLMKREIESAIGKRVFVAKKGLSIELNKEPY